MIAKVNSQIRIGPAGSQFAPREFLPANISAIKVTMNKIQHGSVIAPEESL